MWKSYQNVDADRSDVRSIAWLDGFRRFAQRCGQMKAKTQPQTSALPKSSTTGAEKDELSRSQRPAPNRMTSPMKSLPGSVRNVSIAFGETEIIDVAVMKTAT